MNLSGMKILIFGAGVSGFSAAATLVGQGAKVTLADGNSRQNLKGKKILDDLPDMVELVLGRQDEALLDDKQLMIISPGIPSSHSLAQAALRRGIPLWGEIELAGRLSKAPIIAVTGTNGKTTTTTLLGEMIKKQFAEVVVGGNIGVGLAQAAVNISSEGCIVAEISSFQLECSETFHPHIAVILNLTPDHIDRHGSVEEYKAVKEKIFANQNGADFLVLNQDDEQVRTMSGRSQAKAFFFSRRVELETGAFVSQGNLCLRWQEKTTPICRLEEMKLLGGHNVENALAACSAAFIAGVPPTAMAEVLLSFSGVEHRIEPVATLRGVGYFNDSKATNPESTVKALEAFAGGVILIAGGRDKNTDLSAFLDLVQKKVDLLILIGEAADRFDQAARERDFVRIFRAGSLEEAVETARSKASAPQVVLLSPACASYDMFDNYEQRGQVFKKLVLQGDRTT